MKPMTLTKALLTLSEIAIRNRMDAEGWKTVIKETKAGRGFSNVTIPQAYRLLDDALRNVKACDFVIDALRDQLPGETKVKQLAKLQIANAKFDKEVYP